VCDYISLQMISRIIMILSTFDKLVHFLTDVWLESVISYKTYDILITQLLLYMYN